MAAHDDEIAKMRDFALNQAARAAEYKMQVKFLNRENKRLRKRLNKVHRSWTWRIGRVVLFPYHVVIWALDRVRASRSPM